MENALNALLFNTLTIWQYFTKLIIFILSGAQQKRDN